MPLVTEGLYSESNFLECVCLLLLFDSVEDRCAIDAMT